jgi:hypothetical protein
MKKLNREIRALLVAGLGPVIGFMFGSAITGNIALTIAFSALVICDVLALLNTTNLSE